MALEPVTRQVVSGLLKLGLSLRHQAEPAPATAEGQPDGLTPLQAQVLVLLRAVPAQGMRLAQVSRALAVTMPAATEAVAVLEQRGLLRRAQPADPPSGPLTGQARTRGRAGVFVVLTTAGRSESEKGVSWPGFLLPALESLTPAEQAGLLRSLTKMVRALQEAGQIPVARMCVTCRFFRPDVHDDAERPHHCAFVDAPFGDRHLRLDCAEHEAADAADVARNWQRF